MQPRVEDRSSQKLDLDEIPIEEQRWGNILEKVVSEQQSDDPWYVKLGVSLIWAAGIALATGILAALILGVRALFSANVQFTFRSLSDHIFWAAALLMIAGMLSPSAGALGDGSKNKNQEQSRPRTPEERRAQTMERRMRRVYDPWRWRIWGAAVLTFVLAILAGLFAGPANPTP